MSIDRSNTVGPGRVGTPDTTDGGEIHPVGVPEMRQRISTSTLEQLGALASINPNYRSKLRGIEPLTQVLGIALTAGSPAWTGDPVPKMRALQKLLLEHGMQADDSARSTVLAAISVVEKNIQWRLRLHQLHMSDLQLHGEREAVPS